MNAREVNAWEWQAGENVSGLTDSRRRARRHASAELRSGRADTAVLQQVVIVTGHRALYGHYLPVAAGRTEGRRRGKRIRWRHAAAPREDDPADAP